MAFTAETRQAYIPVAEEMARNFVRLNGIPCGIITPKNFDFSLINSPIWIKAFLWDFVPAGVEKIIWKDSDTVDIKPLGTLPNEPFCAVADPAVPAGILDKKILELYNLDAAEYFNAGFFIADRRTIPMFEEMKTLALTKPEKIGWSVDQTRLNIAVKKHFGSAYILPYKYNCIFSLQPIKADTVMLHYAGQDKKGLYLKIREKLFELKSESSDKIIESKKIEVPVRVAYNGSAINTPAGKLLMYRGFHDSSLHAAWLTDDYEYVSDSSQKLSLARNEDPRLLWHNNQLLMSTSYYDGGNNVRVELRTVIVDRERKVRVSDLAKFDRFECGYKKQGMEKNWLPFSHDGRLLYVYSYRPHRIVEVDLFRGSCRVVHTTNFKEIPWEGKFGRSIHMSTPPIRVGNNYMASFHTHESFRYYTGFYLFEGKPPFRVIKQSCKPVFHPRDASDENLVKGIKLLFPVAAQIENGNLVTTGGQNDSAVVVHRLDLNKILDEMIPVSEEL